MFKKKTHLRIDILGSCQMSYTHKETYYSESRLRQECSTEIPIVYLARCSRAVMGPITIGTDCSQPRFNCMPLIVMGLSSSRVIAICNRVIVTFETR